MSLNSTISSAQVRAARALLGWSQQVLGDHANIAVSTIADFERGQRDPLAINMDAISDAFLKEGIIFKDGGVAINKVPSTTDTLKKVQCPIRWVEATDLEQFAGTRDGQSIIPELINKLIRATVGLESRVLLFPSGDSIRQPGWDGICEVVQDSEYVPSGVSGWEIGCDKKIINKANSDFKKRTDNPLTLDPKETTFIFVSPLRWDGKDKWIKERKTEGKWKNVKAYDANNLVHWLELNPAVGKWFAVRIGKFIPGLRDLNEAWYEWSQSTVPAITVDLVLAGRSIEVERLLNWLKGNASILSVHAGSTDETIAFLYATINQQIPNYNARCLVVSTNDMARSLANSISPLIIILENPEPGIAAVLVQQGHHVYLPFVSETDSSDVIRLSRTPHIALQDHLLKGDLGNYEELGEQQAKNLADKAAHSIVILRRLISLVPGRSIPEWAKPENFNSILIAILLACRWDEGVRADKGILEELSGEKYELISNYLTRWAETVDSPIRKIGNIWRITSPLDLWFLLAHRITSEYFERFSSIFSKVLSAPDLRFDLMSDENWSEIILQQQSNYSRSLRMGLAQTLALFSNFGDRIKYINNISDRVELVMRKLLFQADVQRWKSISEQFVILAEAAPDTFLSAVDESLSQNTPSIMSLFVKDENLFTPVAYPNLLCALELLGWSSNYFALVAQILAKLTRLDPGGQYSNRPSESLKNLFCLWAPQTYVSLDNRMQVLDNLREQESDVAWKLMIELLNIQSIIPQTYRDTWLDIAKNENKEEITRTLVTRGVDNISERLIKDVGLIINRWRELIGTFPKFSFEYREKIIELILLKLALIKEDKSRIEIREILRNLLHRNKTFNNSILSEDEFKKIEKVYLSLEPESFVDSIAWLFSNIRPTLPGFSELSWKAVEAEANRLRKEAVEKLLIDQNMESVLSLVHLVDVPVLVGTAAAEMSLNFEQVLAISLRVLGGNDFRELHFAYGFLSSRLKKHDHLIKSLLVKPQVDKLSTDGLVEVLLFLPRSKENWNKVEEFGKEVEDLFWSKINVYSLYVEQPDEKTFIIRKLLLAKKSLDAVYFIAYYLTKKRGIMEGMREGKMLGVNRTQQQNEEDEEQIKNYSKGLASKLLMRALNQALQEVNVKKINENEATMFQYNINLIFQELDEADKIPKEQMAELEWMYLPWLESSSRSLVVLHETMSKSPEFFVKVLSIIYSRLPDNETQEFDKSDKEMASRAFRLLRSWYLVPGEINGTIDEDVLESWIQKVRRLCKQNNLSILGDQNIGRILAFSSVDVNNIWPVIPVRNVIQKLYSREVEKGILLGVIEKRGVTSRTLTEGGIQEKIIAGNYRRWSQESRIQWPKLAAILRNIASYFDSEAVRFDKDAERMDLS